MNINAIGKLFILIGSVLIISGFLFILFSRFKIPFIGRLPGDIFINKGNFTFYFPITTSIILSIVISFIIYFFNKK